MRSLRDDAYTDLRGLIGDEEAMAVAESYASKEAAIRVDEREKWAGEKAAMREVCEALDECVGPAPDYEWQTGTRTFLALKAYREHNTSKGED
jgi:hypothetical protein